MRNPLNLAAFQAKLAELDPRVVSFDVFDTVVTRTFARPADLFEAVGATLAARGLVAVSPARFGRLRVRAESAARALRADREPNLVEIVAVLGQRCRWGEAQCTGAATEELALERAAIVPVLPLVAWVEAARASGRTIVFLSDMYLPAEFIREILLAHGIATPADGIFVSCEHRVSKYEGGLFRHVLAELGVPAATVLHVGDNEHSDSLVPRRLGLQALRVSATQLAPIERSHLPFSPALDGLPGRLAAAARIGRLNAAPLARDSALNEIGAGLLGPILTCFMLWTFQRARAAGLRRLYFVSRDGQVLRETALALQARLPAFAGIECRYLYGSRIAWHHASLVALTPRHLNWLLNPQPAIDAGILAHRLGVAREVLAGCLRRTPAADLADKTPWNGGDLQRLRAALPACEETLLQTADAPGRVSTAHRYFEQEGLFDGTPWGVVELGWSGSMLTSLYHALGAPGRLTAFYLGQTGEDPELPVNVSLTSFLMDPDGAQVALGPNLWLPEMLEALTAADHPTVLGYRKRDARVEPVFKQATVPMWPPDALAALRGGNRALAGAIDAETLDALAAALADRTRARLIAVYLLAVLTRFTAEPTVELAQPFTHCSFSEDPADEHRRNFARPLGLRAALSSQPFARNELWPQGSLVCSSGTAQALVAGGIPRALRHLRQRLLHR
jgi:FMN phosphatase YigB (HAD superfamily)